MHVRRSGERGHFNFGWLDTFHTFSFSGYYDPNFMGFRSLRVINEDTVEAGQGFPTHPHKDMEILTYVYEGAVAHRDSMGNTTQIQAGEFQIMSAGTGITHSEFNPSEDERLRLLQIWIKPRQLNLKPRYDQKKFTPEDLRDRFKLIVSPDARDGSMLVNQDALLYAGALSAGRALARPLDPERGYWLQVVKGDLAANEQQLAQGDGLAIENARDLNIRADSDGAEFLLFDLA